MWYTKLSVNWHLNYTFIEEEYLNEKTTICYAFSVTVCHAIKYYKHCITIGSAVNI